MGKYFSISETAKIVHMTAEALRHYDRIGLVKPSKKDKETQYRYYTEQDIVRLHTVRALQQMDLPLQEIKRVLEYDDLEKIISFLNQAERKADEKIASLQYSKTKIQLAKADFENKLRGRHLEGERKIQFFPQRVILLSDTLETPSLDNLWNYLSHFYDKIDPMEKTEFSFEDLAGIYTEQEQARLFAVCIRYTEREGLKILPEGDYLCVDCAEGDKERVLKETLELVKARYQIIPTFSVQQVVLSGILHWKYQLQIYLGDGFSNDS